MNDEPERWADVSGYSGLYEVSSHGRFRNVRKRKPIKTFKNKRNGYMYVRLSKEGNATSYRAHRFVLLAFVGEPPPGDTQSRHLDADKTNNKRTNLAWGTYHDNMLDKIRINGRLTGAQPGEGHHNSKLNNISVAEIVRLRAAGLYQHDIAIKVGVTQSNVSRVLSGETWGHLTGIVDHRKTEARLVG